MNRRPGARSAGIVLAAAAAVVCLLLIGVLVSIRGGTRDTIVLPEDSGGAQPEAPTVDAGEPFYTVDRENVQSILEVLSRPAAYVQTLTVTSYWSDGQAERNVQLWCSGSLIRAQITAGRQTQHLLTDGETVWVWYDGEETARALTPDETVTFDDLTGIPTYETLTAIPTEAIEEAGFVTLDEQQGVSCLYVSVADGEDTDRYWVDVNTRLLCRADTLSGGGQIYQLRQTGCQTLTPEDTALQGIFQLPDGTAVSAATGE